MFKYFIFILTLFFINILNAADSLLTLKQQLDRLQREINDLSKVVYTGSRDKKPQPKQQLDEHPNLSAFDLRIYDLEKDLQQLNENFEELIFQIDDLKYLLDELTLSLDTKLANNQQEVPELDQTTTKIEINKEENNLIVNENSLGNLVISSENISNENDGLVLKNNDKTNINIKLNPEDEFQQAFYLLRSQQFDEAKIALKKFIDNNKESNLAGSAHYWLGEIYILSKEYREAALALAEGYQKYPNSSKAPDILYKLSESLIKIEKNTEACGMLKKLTTEHPNHKLSDKSQVRISELGCTIVIE